MNINIRSIKNVDSKHLKVVERKEKLKIILFYAQWFPLDKNRLAGGREEFCEPRW
jgi:hypothetical protein